MKVMQFGGEKCDRGEIVTESILFQLKDAVCSEKYWHKIEIQESLWNKNIINVFAFANFP
jgi:hypothetical protein